MISPVFGLYFNPGTTSLIAVSFPEYSPFNAVWAVIVRGPASVFILVPSTAVKVAPFVFAGAVFEPATTFAPPFLYT